MVLTDVISRLTSHYFVLELMHRMSLFQRSSGDSVKNEPDIWYVLEPSMLHLFQYSVYPTPT